MLFVSIPWLGWMVATVAAYWLFPRSLRLYVLAALSCLFLVSVSPVSAVVLTAFVILCHMVGNRDHISGISLGLTILTIVSTLIWFKMGISLDTQNLASTVIIPIGISYYSFRSIHFLMERFTGRLAPCVLKDLIAYMFFLPTFVIGPIHRFDDFIRDQKRQRFDALLLSEGAERIVYGYVKISVLSNFLVERMFGNWILFLPDQEGALVVYLVVVKNGLNIFLQFSGHSDIAIGFARLLGFRIIENFNWPYLQKNISDFWRAWHISLSSWCRDYIYDPVVSMTRKPALGAIMTMFVMGMWHEFSMRYLYWGLYHGLGIVVWQSWQVFKPKVMLPLPKKLRGIGDAAAIILTVHFVWFSFVIVTEKEIKHALSVFSTIFFWWL